ncbi:MAG: MBL fold metallo-hydrolase [Acidobacteriota bacterium]|nr:MBL fold metallo-hydrolase [Acidobacteriota bacterium]
MRVTFLGTGTSSGVPVVGCDCSTCHSDDPRDRRWRPSVYLELDDATRVLIDTTPDFRSQALQWGITGLDVILFTHYHADHIMGLDDVRPFNFRQSAAIPCLGDASTLAALRRVFAYVWDPATPKGGGLPRLRLVEVRGRFSIGRAHVVPVPLLHGTHPILGYRVNDFAYLTDCSAITETSWPLLEGLDVVVLDALRHRPHPTHFSLEEAVAAAARIGARRTYFTHICHDLPHAATCAVLPPGVTLAHDGLVVDLLSSNCAV